MKNNIRQMLKTVVEENAVAFKEQATKVLYGKVGTRLQEQYKVIAKDFLGKKESK